MLSDTYVFPSLLIIYMILVCMMLLYRIYISCCQCEGDTDHVLGFGSGARVRVLDIRAT